ncbi:MAG: hypothetical protein EXR85_00470 [Xanthomonadales bacterium]|nr:hypothetical protein [Xanthomonadales bacterium]
MIHPKLFPGHVRDHALPTLKMVTLSMLLVLGEVFAQGLADSGSPVAGYAIVNVTVVPMTSETTLPGQTVLVQGGEITAVGPAADIPVPAGFQRIDGSGKFLAPGLADMHAHPMTQLDLNLFLANGVTLIRSMWGEPVVLQMREEIAAGTRIGPRIITGGRIVDGDPVIHYGTDRVLNEQQAHEVVQAQKAAGYDFIKVYSNLSLEAFDAIAEEAKANGIPFAGHIPRVVPAQHAFASGMLTSEHLTGISSASMMDGVPYPEPWTPDFVAFAEGLGSGQVQLDDVYDEAKLIELAQSAAETGHWLVPTVVVLRGVLMSPEEKAAQWQRPEMLYTDFTVKNFWKSFQSWGGSRSEDYYLGAGQVLAQSLHQVKDFHDAGARILAGTDAPNPFVYVGFSVVEELELFVQAGLTPFEALKTATVNVAEFNHEAGRAGMIGVGSRADLVLLGEDPLHDVGAYREISGVIAAGNFLGREKLDQLLTAAVKNNEWKAALFAAEPVWPLNVGEKVPLFAGFSLTNGAGDVGTERIASASSESGAIAVLAERKDSNGMISTWRLESDADGGFKRLLEQTHSGSAVTETEISRQGLVYSIRRTDGTKAEVSSDAAVLVSNTGADALALRTVFDSMQDGEARELEALCVAGESLAPCGLTITRQPSEVIEGHFYFSGVNRYDIVIKSQGEERESHIWMGGGFYAGWPVRIELQQTGSARAVLKYTRIL